MTARPAALGHSFGLGLATSARLHGAWFGAGRLLRRYRENLNAPAGQASRRRAVLDAY